MKFFILDFGFPNFLFFFYKILDYAVIFYSDNIRMEILNGLLLLSAWLIACLLHKC
jgi:hypothetical protein